MLQYSRSQLKMVMDEIQLEVLKLKAEKLRRKEKDQEENIEM